MSISNKNTLRLKKTVVNGRNQTVYYPRVYRPRELPQLVIDENEQYIEIVESVEKPVDTNSSFVPEKGVEIKMINNVIETPKEPVPEEQEIVVDKPVEKVITKRVRKSES